MRLASVTRSFGVRVAAITTAMILGSMLVLGAAVYSLIDDVLEHTVAGQIEDETARLLGLYGSNDTRAAIAEIMQRTRAEVTRRYAYRISDAEGRHIAGDPWITAIKPGWSKQPAPAVVDSTITGGQVLVLTTLLQTDVRLSIGRDIRWVADVERELLGLLRWALLGGVTLAALTAYLTMRLVAQRIELVVGSVHAIMHGDLKQRVPVAGAADDFDHLAEMLNEMLDRIQGLIGDVEQVTNDIAHDLRTPLGRLRQGLEQARGHATTTDAYARAVDRAIAEADGLLSTFTALLRIAQVEAGGRRANFRDVDLSDIMRSVVEAYELSAEESGHHLVATIADGASIDGDRDLLVQAFANLIENALTHTPAGSTVTLTLQRGRGALVAAISDDGPGVPATERDKILQRFYRLEQSRTTPGTGLGLSLVAAVAKVHGARVDVGDNQPGLRISLTFPSE